MITLKNILYELSKRDRHRSFLLERPYAHGRGFFKNSYAESTGSFPNSTLCYIVSLRTMFLF